MKHIDDASTVRSGEELNLEKLKAYLQEELPVFQGELSLRQFGRGFSNLTYLLTVGERELVLRRPPFGANIATAHDMKREYHILSHLIRVYHKIPRPFLLCEDPEILGAPFFLMERKRGVILRNQVPEDLDLNETTMEHLSKDFISLLAELHSVDCEAAGLDHFGKPEGYVARQVNGWTKRYNNAKTDEIPEIEQTAAWLLAHMPAESGASLIHNDFKYDNMILDRNELSNILAILDWEMATVGDPMMDLGTTLAYWADPDDPPMLKQFGLTHLPGNLNRRQLVEAYAKESGQQVKHPVFYYAYGLFKVAVICQQIYARYKAGHTKDPRFAGLIHLVRCAGQMASRAIELNRVDDLQL